MDGKPCPHIKPKVGRGQLGGYVGRGYVGRGSVGGVVPLPHIPMPPTYSAVGKILSYSSRVISLSLYIVKLVVS